MNTHTFRSTRIVAVLALGAALSGVTSLAMSDDAPASLSTTVTEQAVARPNIFPGSVDPRSEMRRARLTRILDGMANRLEITATQQQAWQTFGTMVMNLADASALTRPVANADAATLLRFRAERSGERAQKLAKLAEATADLQASLTPDQNAVLKQMTRGLLDRQGHKRQFEHARGR